MEPRLPDVAPAVPTRSTRIPRAMPMSAGRLRCFSRPRSWRWHRFRLTPTVGEAIATTRRCRPGNTRVQPPHARAPGRPADLPVAFRSFHPPVACVRRRCSHPRRLIRSRHSPAGEASRMRDRVFVAKSTDARVVRISVALLALAQLLLPALGVAHAHESRAALSADATARRTVHGHGAGLPHEHTPGRADDASGESDFRALGTPVATLRASTAEWISAGTETPVPVGASIRAGCSDPAAGASTLRARRRWLPDAPPGLTLEPAPRGRSGRGFGHSRSLRGPPFSV